MTINWIFFFVGWGLFYYTVGFWPCVGLGLILGIFSVEREKNE